MFGSVLAIEKRVNVGERYITSNVTVFQGSIAFSSLFWGSLPGYFSTLSVVKMAAASMGLASVAVLLIPMEDGDAVAAGSVACTEPLIQYQLK